MHDNLEEIVSNSKFLKKWRKQMITPLKRMHPEWDENEMNDILNEMIKEKIQIPRVTLDNNYTGESKESNVLNVMDWCLKRKPIIAGNATFYRNQDEALNPIRVMLLDFMKQRKNIKKEMFAIEDSESRRYKDLDRGQKNKKTNTNAYYGASAMPSSALFSKWSGPATTGTGQSVIGNCETLFEAFLVYNYKFIDINEVFVYMESLLKEDYELDDFIVRVSKEELLESLRFMYFDKDNYKDLYDRMINEYLDKLTTEQITKIYYKYNFIEFTKRHDKIINLHRKILKKVNNYKYAEKLSDIPVELIKYTRGRDEKNIVKSYNQFVNKEYFINPNEPPESIQKELQKLNHYYMKYTYARFPYMERIHRLKHFKRRTVCLVDSDSTQLTVDEWVNFFTDMILDGDYGRDYENNKFIMVNILSYILASVAADSLEAYGACSNIPKEYRKYLNIKNEFYMEKFLIGRAKKRYLSAIRLREGNLMSPYKPDVKGFDFSKSGTSDEAETRFNYIVKKYILDPPVPDIASILGELRKFENDIKNSLLRGELTFLPIVNCKEIEAYKNPYSQQSVRGSIAWNTLYPDNPIRIPTKVSVLKLNIFDLSDITKLSLTHHDIYESLKKGIFYSPNKNISSKGVQVICIPKSEVIPEWCMPYIDYTTVINNILAPFKGVLAMFGVVCPEVGKSIKSVNRKTSKFTNIVNF